jgi:tubulin monoglycylase TTLL3/8
VPGQILPHCVGTVAICSKLMLMKNIRSLGLERAGMDTSEFFPRCYEIKEESDLKNFLVEFKVNKIESFLKKKLFNLKKSKRSRFRDSPKGSGLPKVQLTLEMLELAQLSVALIVLARTNYFYASLGFGCPIEPVLLLEWELFNMTEDNMPNGEQLKLKMFEYFKSFGKDSYEIYTEALLFFLKNFWSDIYMMELEKSEDLPIDLQLVDKFVALMDSVIDARKVFHPQHCIDGTDGIWILKPTGMSRGRGIICLNTLPEILHYMLSSDCEFVAQKYIERPLIINKRKFDVRQWALVNSFSELEVWVYDEFYVRFAASDYTTGTLLPSNKNFQITCKMSIPI